MPNSLTERAEAAGRRYITPEDVGQALRQGVSEEKVRLEVLEVLGKQTRFGAEDAGLCAFLAWRGRAGLLKEDEEGSG